MDKVLKQRATTAFFFTLAVMVMILSGLYGIVMLLSLILIGITSEMMIMLRMPLSYILALVGGQLILFGLLSHFGQNSDQIAHFMVGAGVATHIGLMLLLFSNGKKTMVTITSYGFWLYPLLGLASFLVSIYESYRPIQLILPLLILIWVCDSAAYLVGRKIGKTKLYTRVSPNKTWEGAVGALVCSVLTGLIFSYFLKEQPLLFWLALSLIVAVFGTIGDLYESQIKRIFNIKDSGNIMPGHGGIWDRFDSFVFILPFYCLLLLLFNL